MLKQALLKLPTPSSVSFMWNFGSILGLSLVVQIVTGLLLSMHFCADFNLAFSSVVHISVDVNNGWLIRFLHANGATMFFTCIYLHISRGIYYKSYNNTPITWLTGVVLLLSFMGVAFLGYVLPWGQMSYWGATVITNLISAVPYVGGSVVEWVWGGFSVGGPTLSRFYSLHFILPLASVVVVLGHLVALHETGSSNPLGVMKSTDKVSFHPYFSVKDVLGFYWAIVTLVYFSNHSPLAFMDSDNFMEANPLVTPVHIQPEWYFLFAYAILRSIPNKLGGVVGLLLSILVILLAPMISSRACYSGAAYQVRCLLFFMSFCLLTFLGAMPVETPYSEVSVITSVGYFVSFVLMMI